MENSIALLDERAKERGIRLTLEEIDIQHGRVIGNPLYLQQILMNIIDNAIKYNHPQGAVFVQAKEMSCQGDTAEYQFVVEDLESVLGRSSKSIFSSPLRRSIKVPEPIIMAWVSACPL